MRPRALSIAVVGAALAACGDPNALPPPGLSNVVDTVVIYAVTGTEVWQPSGYSMTERRAVRLDRTNQADFAFDFRDGVPLLLPGSLVGHPGSSGLHPGLQHLARPFDSVKVAEVNGYVSLDTLHAAVGDVFFARSRIPPNCFFGLPTYAKLEVLEIDPVNRTFRFRTLVNRNCGYKGLEPGLPTQ
ncbi:MAG TPA: hypothetical protein VGA42_09980 [Gemmatimonadales bacterium]